MMVVSYLVSREGRPRHREESEGSHAVVDADEDDVIVAEEDGVEVGHATAKVQPPSVDIELGITVAKVLKAALTVTI